jgi:hypothetical protein
MWSFSSSSLSPSFSSFGIVAHVIDSSCVDVGISLAAFYHLLGVCCQSQVNLLDLHHMPVGDKEACACVPINSRQH